LLLRALDHIKSCTNENEVGHVTFQHEYDSFQVRTDNPSLAQKSGNANEGHGFVHNRILVSQNRHLENLLNYF